MILTGSTLLGALAAPRSGAASLITRVLPLPDTFAEQGRRLLAPSHGASPAYAAAAAVFKRELSVAPAKTDAWLGLAYAEERRAGGRLSPAASRALANSYDVAPFDGAVFSWRSRFAFAHWPDLGPATQAEARQELKTMWIAAPMLRPQIEAQARAAPTLAARQAATTALEEAAREAAAVARRP